MSIEEVLECKSGNWDRDVIMALYEHANHLLEELDMWPPDEMED